MTKTLTALELISDRALTRHRAATNYRDRIEDRRERDRIDGKSYNMGAEAGLCEARAIMEKELRRLCNLFQNGALSIDAFGIEL
jgi:hypothetical protein